MSAPTSFADPELRTLVALTLAPIVGPSGELGIDLPVGTRRPEAES